MELLHNDELRVYVFDDTMISQYMIGNDILSALEYLFECQFAFMSNGSAYLDFNGFSAGMRKCNIHFETPEIAIPLIFEQLVGINANNHNNNNHHHDIKNKKDKNDKKNKKTKIDYNHVFIAEDTFVEWMMNYIRIHINGANHHQTNQFDERIDKLFDILQSIYKHCKYQNTISSNNNNNSNKKKKRKSASPNITKDGGIINPFEVESLYASSPSMGQQRQTKDIINFKSLGLPPRTRHNEYHQNINHSTKQSIQSFSNNRYIEPPSIHSLHAQSTINHAQPTINHGSNRKHRKSVKPLRNTNHNHNDPHLLYKTKNKNKYKQYKNRSNHKQSDDDLYYTEY